MKFKKLLKHLLIWLILLPFTVLALLISVIYIKQDDIVQHQLNTFNKGHQGWLKIGDTHLAPFANFPDVSFKIDDVLIYEYKTDTTKAILDVKDIYVGFNLWDIFQGNYDVHSLLIEDGYFNFVLHEEGSNNFENALALTASGKENEGEELKIHLQSIELVNLDIHKYNESSKTDVETFIYNALGGFKQGNGLTNAHIDADFKLDVFIDGDTTYIHDKFFEFHTDIHINEETGVIDIEPSSIVMEHGDFQIEGSIDTKNDNSVDLDLSGKKPNFDMFIAFAPHDVIPVLERYRNAGDIYLNAKIEGPTAKGLMPFIDVQFGASKAFLENTEKAKTVDGMGFKGHFTNGASRNLETMEFSLENMTANLDKGKFVGALYVTNFLHPDIRMEMDADFDVKFLLEFLNIDAIKEPSGEVEMHMKFHDVIDLSNPELALKDLNKAYFSDFKVNNLHFASNDLPAPLENLNLHMIMQGKQAEVRVFDLQLGNTDLMIKGYLSDLPAVVHHTNIPVTAHLEVESKLLDLAELTNYSEEDSTGINEQIEDLRVGLSLKSSAKAILESEHLPTGEFFVDSLHAQLKHYPHELHDFHADILIDEQDLKIVDFTGHIDQSDFHFDGLVHDYKFWFQPELNGDVDLDVSIHSDRIKLEDVFSYKGENYVPKDYRHEEFDKLEVHVNSSFHYKNSHLHSVDVDLDKFTAKMHVHPMRFHDFNGRIHYEDEHIMLQKFHGEIGRSNFDVDLNYYLGEDPKIKKRDNYLGLKAGVIDLDQLSNFNPQASTNTNNTKTTSDSTAHVEAFNIYELPFTDMKYDLDIAHFINHRLDIKNINAQLRTTQNHYLYIDTLNMNMAGGSVALSGYFNGSDPEHIYLKPNLNLNNVDIDKLLFKFENFGQDAILSENLHGKLSSHISGNIRVYPDLVPDLDESEIHMDVLVLDGRLLNYEPMQMLSDYFGDKNLNNLRFDTLSNHIDMTNGLMTVPNMTLETTIGHMDISGTQSLNDEIEYYIRIPLKMIGQGMRYKLFGDKKSNGESTEDEIIEVDPDKKVRYLNLKIYGTIDDFKILTAKAKKKKKKKV